MKIIRSHPFHIFCIGIFIGIGFLWYYIRVGATLPFAYYDEAWWIGDSYFYDLLLHDRKNPVWDTVYSYDQPQLAHYIFGAALYPNYLQKKGMIPTLTYLQYISNHRLLCQECIDANGLPRGVTTVSNEQFSRDILKSSYSQTRDIILFIRKFNAIVAACTVVVLYVLGQMMWGTFGGVLFGLLYGFNGLIMRTTLVAHADALFLFFYSCVLLMFYLFFHKHTKRNAIGVAVCIGLAASVKIVGFMLLPLVFIFQIIRLIQKRIAKAEIRAVMMDCIIILTVLFGVFILLNPYVQKDTIWRMHVMFDHRMVQQQLFSIWHRAERLTTMTDRLFSVGYRYFSYPSLFSAPLILSGYRGFFNIFYSLFAVLGLISYGMKLRSKNNRVLLIYFLPIAGYCIWIIMPIWLMVGWDRYYTVIAWVAIGLQVEGLLYICKRMRYAR